VARSGEGGSGEGTRRRGDRCAVAVRALLAVCASAEVSRVVLLLGDGQHGECTWEQGLARVCGAGSVDRSGTGGGRHRAVSSGWDGGRLGRVVHARDAGACHVWRGKGGAEQARARVGGSELSGQRSVAGQACAWRAVEEREKERRGRKGRKMGKGK
jgi:hypothetical protein